MTWIPAEDSQLCHAPGPLPISQINQDFEKITISSICNFSQRIQEFFRFHRSLREDKFNRIKVYSMISIRTGFVLRSCLKSCERICELKSTTKDDFPQAKTVTGAWIGLAYYLFTIVQCPWGCSNLVLYKENGYNVLIWDRES